MKVIDNILDFIFGAQYKDYTPALRILTKNEQNFYHALKYFFKGCYILPKVCLRSIFEAKNKPWGEKYTNTAKIKNKHVDFTVINKNLEIEYCFELDDNSHYYPSVQERDRLVDEVFNDAGVKLVRVLSSRRYDEYTIQAALSELKEPQGKNIDYKPKKLFSKKEAAAYLELIKNMTEGEVISYKISLREFFATINENNEEAFYYLSKRLVSFAIYSYYEEKIKKIVMLTKADKDILADRFFKKLCKNNCINYEIL